MSKSINLAPGFDVPIDVVTESISIIGRRGSGKTVTANRLAEGMLDAGQQVVFLDPTNASWGLRSSADGKRDGYAIPIFGGQRGDIPLEDTMGRALADALIETRSSAVVCVRDFSKTGARRFVGDFAEQLYERKCEGQFRTPLHLFLDEADAFVPQRIQKGGERAYGAIDTIVRRGRIDGFGTSLISQRPAVIAKDVLTQTEVLVCHQVTGPHDQKALLAWMEEHGTDEQRREFLATLASLKKGEAWFWSPAWLETFRRVQVRMRSTWNSSQTPKVGEKLLEPEHMAAVDLEEIRKHLAPKPTASKAGKGKRGPAPPLDVSSVDSAELEGLREENQRLREHVAVASGIEHEKALDCLHRAQKELAQAIEWIAADKAAARAAGLNPISAQASSPPRRGTAEVPREEPARERTTFARTVPEGDVSPTSGIFQSGKCARFILTALCQLGPLSLEQAAITAGYASDSGGVRNAAGELRAAGYVDGGNAQLTATARGRAALGKVKPLPTGPALHAFWLTKLGKADREILSVVVAAFPKAVSLEAAARKCEYAANSGGVRNAAGRLRTLALVTGGNSAMTANERLVR